MSGSKTDAALPEGETDLRRIRPVESIGIHKTRGMAFLKMFRTPKHQQFEYKPRHWDPQKEELEERLQRIEEMKRGDMEGVKARISGNLRRSYKGNEEYRRKLVMRSNTILLIVLAAIVILGILVVQYFLPQIVAFSGE